MKERLMKILICPECNSSLKAERVSKAEGEIKDGQLVCVKCGNKYPIRNYIPRFVETDKYVGNFSREWYAHKTTQLDSKSGTKESEEIFKRKTDFDLNELKGDLVLDVGCGTGRFMEIGLKHGAEVVGIDLSFAVDVAQENIGKNKNAHIVQADIFNLPFKNESFDKVFSIGVLHHTPSTKDAFLNITSFLKKGGEIAVWVYSDEGWYMKLYNRSSNFWRFFARKLPPTLLYTFCKYWANLMYPLKKIRFLRVILQIILPPSNNHPRWKVLDTYDWLSPKYQWKHTHDEVENWFKRSGLKEIKRLNYPIAVRGKK